MKRIFAIAIVAVLALSLLPAAAFADKPCDPEEGYNGNGAPSGYHFTLNIIGVQNEKSADMTYENGSGRSSIFVPLEGKSRIYLHSANELVAEDVAFKDAFAVLDANGTDGRADFMLPDPGLDPYMIGGNMLNPDGSPVDTMADYKIVLRPLGKPDGSATMVTCAELADNDGDGEADLLQSSILPNSFAKAVQNEIDLDTGAYISMQPVPEDFTFRDTGKSRFEDVTAYLLTMVFEITLIDEAGNIIDTVYVRVPIFDDFLQNEYWLYDNDGLKNLQIRFYAIPTDIQYADAEYL